MTGLWTSGIYSFHCYPKTIEPSSFLHFTYSIARFFNFSHPPPQLVHEAPPLSSLDISVANDLRWQGQRQPHQTLPAVERFCGNRKKEAFYRFLFFSFIFSIFFLFSFSALLVIFSKYLALKNWYENSLPSVLKRKETDDLYGGTERNLCIQTVP